jgi:hypothetical protein
MNRLSLWSLGIAAVSASVAASASDAEVQALREEIAQMRAAYEKRIAALEARLGPVRADGAAALDTLPPPLPAPPPPAAATVAANERPGSEAAFNPGISAVLAGTYTALSQNPKTYAIGGFIPPGSDIGPPRKGFGLGESEVGLSANIDHLFRGLLTFSLSPDGGGAEVEEAYIQTLGLGHGATLKAGRYLSGIGYLNGQHAHVWDFADAPLAYKAFLGGQARSDGLQVKWLAPTDLLLELGGELANGGGFPSTDRNKNGNTVGALYAHLGGDLGTSHSWRAGISLVGTSPEGRQYGDVATAGGDVTNSFSGRSRTWLMDGVWKWAPEGNATVRNLVIQGEYFRRRENGSLTYDGAGANRVGDFSSAQSGFYAQTVYQFQPYWRVGYRYDRLNAGKTDIGLVRSGTLAASDFPALAAYRPKRNSLMIDWTPSEFSRLRLQWARDLSRPDAPDNQWWLQYIVSLGAHGAHNF